MTSKYIAHIVEVPEHGIRLEPKFDATIPTEPNDVNLLAMAVALAMGAADYEHHPQPRDPALQTLDALLTGDTTMPWRSTKPVDAAAPRSVECDQTSSGAWHCHVVD